ncbi:MAG TPA: hypothetical protein EYQ26_09465 [Rhodospirillales bacterium]|jgi:hypothetical protein|nr:hypothetical protein [Rhodospirillales bacterium]
MVEMDAQLNSKEIGPPIRILNWSAWAPNLTAKAAWIDYLKSGTLSDVVVKKPPCKNVPEILRRRCTFVTRMLLETSLDVFSGTGVAPDSAQMVFCSCHGELQVLGSLLHDIHSEVPLSPTQFSNSVHHTATGYFDLVTKNKQTSRTISAGMSSFVNGYLEAIGLLKIKPDRACLLVMADETPAQPFAQDLKQPWNFSYAIAWLLELAKSNDRDACRLTRSESSAPCTFDDKPPLSFLRWFVEKEEHCTLKTPNWSWTWTKNHYRP